MGLARNSIRRITWLCVSICAAGAVVGCAPHAPNAVKTENVSENPVSAVAFTWSPDSDCAMCHAIESESMQDSAYPAALHEQEAADCPTCHADDSKLSVAHEGVLPDSEMPQRLKSTAVPEQLCLDCHDDVAVLAQATEDRAALIDSEGTVVNPHELSESEDHEGVSCSDCHKMHSSDPVEEIAIGACLSCHHEGVFECYTCHE
ncbi:cytochrome c3 family protein [Raoultibacter phocaeensis]|uniref:cytochrome c3 family protein n=1 Tax=Raoultibacter phocaeensis TaxID=2479841 RepID=UPI001119F741|nr:cytochrome c3 family protein [Raoultibacter phocaeensis]